MRIIDAVIAGYICVDLIPDFKENVPVTNLADFLKPGKLIEIGGLNSTLGGVVANTGMAMKKFSKNVFLNGLIGDDLMGKFAKEYLDTHNASTGINITREEGSAFSLVIAPPGVDRIFLESPGCSRLFDLRDINFDAVAQSRLFHFGYPPLLKKFYADEGVRLQTLFSRVQEMGVVTSMDFSSPDCESDSGRVDWPGILEKVLPFTNIFVPSLEEALQIMMPDKYGELLASSGSNEVVDLVPIDLVRKVGRQILNAGAQIVLLKAGHRGAFLLTGNVSQINSKAEFNLTEKTWNNQELWYKACPVDAAKIKNASGAGDTASAAFLSAILDGEDPEQALQFAAIAGRNNLYCYDIYRELDDWSDMRREMKVFTSSIIDLKNINDTELVGYEQTNVAINK